MEESPSFKYQQSIFIWNLADAVGMSASAGPAEDEFHADLWDLSQVPSQGNYLEPAGNFGLPVIYLCGPMHREYNQGHAYWLVAN